MKKIIIKQDIKDKVLTLSLSGIIVAVFVMLVQSLPEIFGHIKNFLGVISPFLWGLLFAYLGKGLALKIETHLPKKWSFNVRRIIGSIVTIIFIVLCLAIVVIIIVPQLLSSISSISVYVQKFISNPTSFEWYRNVLSLFGDFLNDLPSKISSNIGTLLSSVTKNTTSIINTASGFVGQVANFGIGLIVALFFLIERGKIKKSLMSIGSKYLSSKNYKTLKELYILTVSKFYDYFRGNIIDCVLVGIECFIGMSILRLEYTSLISVIVGLTNIIPFFGPFIGGIPSFLLLLLVDPIQAIKFGILVILIQQIDGNFVAPKILGDSVGVPRLWCMFVIIVGGAYFGFFGMIFGVPLFSVIYFYVSEYLNHKKTSTK